MSDGVQLVATTHYGFPADPNGYIVAYSGGKDSLVVMDMAYRLRERTGYVVRAYHMELVPGMDHSRFWADYAANRWGIDTTVICHWMTNNLIRDGIFRQRPDPSVPRLRSPYSEKKIRSILHPLEWIGYGYKMMDSLQRRGMMKSWPGGVCPSRKVFAPLSEYSHTDVLRYLQRRNIALPKSIGGRAVSGVDLSPESMLYLKTNWSRDYERVLAVFPLAQAQYLRANRDAE